MRITTAAFSFWIIGFGAVFIAAALAYEASLAAATMFLLCAAFVCVVTAPTKLGLLSWGAGIPMFYVMFFIVLPLTSRLLTAEEQVDDAAIAMALLIAGAGVLSFALGSNAMRLFRSPSNYSMLGLLQIDWASKKGSVVFLAAVGTASLAWSYVFGYFGLISTPANEVSNVAGALHVTGFLLTIAHVVAWNVYFTQRKFLFVGTATALILVVGGMMANSKGQMLAPFALIALCLWGATGKFPYKLIAISLLLYIFIAFPFVTASRYAMAALTLGASRGELADMALQYLLSGRWIDESSEFSAVASLGDRLLPYFTEIVRQAGNAVPYFEGKTLKEGFEIMMPRFLHPDKPDLAIGNWTGQAFGEVHWQDDITNLSPTFIGEFYMNFGLPGVCVGMFLTGMLAILVDRYVIVHRHSWTMPIMVSFIGWQEAFIGHSILPFIKSAIVWLPLLILLKHFARNPLLPPGAVVRTNRAMVASSH